MMMGMADSTYQLGLYLHLARASELRRRPMVRDRLLVLAGVIAAQMGLTPIAAYCRHKVLEHNPQHLVRRWPTLETAGKDDDFQHYLKQLRRRYPSERVEQMLDSLGIQMAREREAYFSDDEYAAAIMGTTREALDEMFGNSGSE